MNYEERIVCFIDVLGFKSTINQSISEDDVRKALYKVLSIMRAKDLSKAVYGSMPFIDLGGKEIVLRPYREAFPDDFEERLSGSFPITITQFSDSFVLSCPSNNRPACHLLFKCLFIINLNFFVNLGLMVRGGVTIGRIIHEGEGVLFGPAMNRAYSLESKNAIYPRVIIDCEYSEKIKELLCNYDEFKAINQSFDGFYFFDLISIVTNCPQASVGSDCDIEARLKDMEQDVLKNSPEAHPKIKYLLTEWEKYKSS